MKVQFGSSVEGFQVRGLEPSVLLMRWSQSLHTYKNDDYSVTRGITTCHDNRSDYRSDNPINDTK